MANTSDLFWKYCVARGFFSRHGVNFLKFNANSTRAFLILLRTSLTFNDSRHAFTQPAASEWLLTRSWSFLVKFIVLSGNKPVILYAHLFSLFPYFDDADLEKNHNKYSYCDASAMSFGMSIKYFLRDRERNHSRIFLKLFFWGHKKMKKFKICYFFKSWPFSKSDIHNIEPRWTKFYVFSIFTFSHKSHFSCGNNFLHGQSFFSLFSEALKFFIHKFHA